MVLRWLSDARGENMKKYRLIKVLSVFLAGLLIVASMPSAALAAEEGTSVDSQSAEEIDNTAAAGNESSTASESSETSKEESSEISEDSEPSDPNSENTDPENSGENSEPSENPDESSKGENSEESDKDESSKEESEKKDEKTPHLVYQAHVQNIGWMKEIKDGELAGTTGRSLRLEALRADIKDSDKLDVSYQVSVLGLGWQDAQKDMATAGTVGQSLPVEAISMSLTGEDAEKYDIYYCVHVQEFGWLAWAKNGEPAGTSRYSYRIEALRAVLVEKGKPAPQALSGYTSSYKVDVTPHLVYQVHVQDIGWMSEVKDGKQAGTTGRSLRLEALKAGIRNTDTLGITYQTKVKGLGWLDAQSDMAAAGTTGKSLPVEAISMSLTGPDADQYDIYYCVHVQEFGWMNWAKNGEPAGTDGFAFRIEALEAKLVKKGEPAPTPLGSNGAAYYTFSFQYSSCIQSKGWTGPVGCGVQLGTPNSKLRLEALKIDLSTSGLTGGISYQSHVQSYGWENSWKTSGNVTGMAGQKRLEGIKIKLTGQLAGYFRVWYRTYVQGYGWTGWARDGQPCGSQKLSLRIEAIQISILPKSSGAPGSTANTFYEGDPAQIAMKNKVQGMGSLTNYIILVNRTTHHVGVYKGSKGHWSEVFYSACGDGSRWTPTPEGVFNVGEKLYNFSDFSTYTAWYATQVYGGIYFHSILYAPFENHPNTIVDPALGAAVSHGCIRLSIDKAYWIFRNIPGGTTVVVYH